MRIAVFTDTFPAISETFIARQIEGLVGLGNNVHIYAEQRPEPGARPQSASGMREPGLAHQLCRYTARLRILGDARSPALGTTRLPGAEKSIPNAKRLLHALPLFARCLLRAPGATAISLDPARYGYAARSLSTLYRVSALLNGRGRYHVAHAHFGPASQTSIASCALCGEYPWS